MSLNQVIIQGNVGKDPELKHLPSGAAVCKFSVATSKKWTDKDGKAQEKTEWHTIITWQKQAENCGKYVKKGSVVLVVGELSTRMWEKDGVKHYTTEIIASNVQFISGPKTEGAPATKPSNPEPSKQTTDQPITPYDSSNFSADDIPF